MLSGSQKRACKASEEVTHSDSETSFEFRKVQVHAVYKNNITAQLIEVHVFVCERITDHVVSLNIKGSRGV